MKIANMKVGTRMGIGFACVLALLLFVMLTGVNGVSRINGKLEDIAFTNNPATDQVVELYGSNDDLTIALSNIILLSSEEEKAPEMARVKRDLQGFDAIADKLGKIFAGSATTAPEENARLAKARKLHQEALPIIDRVRDLGFANRSQEATTVLLQEFRPLQQQLQATLRQSVDFQRKMNGEAAVDGKKVFGQVSVLLYAVSAAALVLGALIAWYIARGITRPIAQALAVARTVAAGDLSSHIDASSKDETGQLLLALKNMNDSLTGIVGEVRSGTDSIAAASGQIAGGNLELSSRTEQQASSLEETASSMEELTSTVRQNADNARQANGLAVSASEVARKGGAVVAEVVGTMGAINASAKRIVDIISVIDGIAFQTNILALNAAVEAARAGEQGRGFAVVATEVRNLAQRSAAAAKEIKALIDDSVEKVEAGSKLVDQAGTTMDEIVSSISRVTDIMGDITSASQEQSAGIDQVNQSVAQMDQVTQQNAALVEEAAAATESLQVQAGKLVQAVSVFKLPAVAADAVATVRATRPAVAPSTPAAVQPLALGLGSLGRKRLFARG